MAEPKLLNEVDIRFGKRGDGKVHFRREPRKILCPAVAKKGCEAARRSSPKHGLVSQ